MRKTVLLLLFMAAAAVAQQAPPPFPPGATLEQKREIIRQRMNAAKQQAMEAQQAAVATRQQAAARAARTPEEKARDEERGREVKAIADRQEPLIREWIKAEQGTEDFSIKSMQLRGLTSNEKHRGAEETRVVYECKGYRYFRIFYTQDGKVIDVEVKQKF